MNTSETILVIFLSTFLTLFLILSTVLVVMLIKFTKKMHQVADTAQEIVDKASSIAGNVEGVADMFKRSAGPLALGKYLMNIAEMVQKHKKGKK